MALIDADSNKLKELILEWVREEHEAQFYEMFTNRMLCNPGAVKFEPGKKSDTVTARFIPQADMIADGRMVEMKTVCFPQHEVVMAPNETPRSPYNTAHQTMMQPQHLSYLKDTIFRVPTLYNSTLARFKKYVADMVNFIGHNEHEVACMDIHGLAMDVGKKLWPSGFNDKTSPWDTNRIPTTPESTETTLMRSFKFEEKHYMNDLCIEDMTDDQIIATIAGIQEDSKALEEMGIESKRINKQLKDMAAAVTQMIAHLDGREDSE